jgi:hypothetical protein
LIPVKGRFTFMTEPTKQTKLSDSPARHPG